MSVFVKRAFYRLILNRLLHLDKNTGLKEGLILIGQATVDQKRYLFAALACNLGVALVESGTIGLLIVALDIVIDDGSFGLNQKLGALGVVLEGLIGSVGKYVVFVGLVALAVLAQIIKSGVQFLSQAASAFLTTRVSRQIQEEITRQTMSFSYAEISSRAAGSLSVNYQLAEVVVGALVMKMFSNGLLAICLTAVYFVFMINISPLLTLSALVVFGIIFVAMNSVVRKLKELGGRLTLTRIGASKVLIEYLNAPRLLRIMSGTVQAENHINQTRSQVLDTVRKSMVTEGAIAPTIDALIIAGIGVFLISTLLALGEGISLILPGFLVFIFILNRLMPQLKTLNSSRIIFSGQLKNIETLGMFLRKADKQYLRQGGEIINGLKKEIRFEDVSFAYTGETETVLKNINFCLPHGSSLALVGSSGAGKSSLVDLLLGLYSPTSGVIKVDSHDLKRVDNSAWLGQIGVVDQEVYLLNASILENIRFARTGVSDSDIEEVAKAAHVHEFVSQLRNGYDTVIGDRGYKLSGGQRQRVALARALLNDPDILILDEATSALDSESERLIQDTLASLRSSRTIVTIAHRLSTISEADQILVLHEGRLVEQGTREELIKINGRFAELWKLQSVSSTD